MHFITTTMKLRPANLWILFVPGFIISCKNLDLSNNGDKYYYYPSKNVYYDVERSNFLYSLDSGKTWDSVYSPSATPAIEGKRETVYSTEPPVWKDNEAHRKMYNGVVLNIINEQNLKVHEPPSKKTTASNTSNQTGNEAEKKERKRPIKRFFQKLFGKKK